MGAAAEIVFKPLELYYTVKGGKKMPKNDIFTCSLRNYWGSKGYTIPKVAELICMSPRQLARHLGGETKGGIMPIPIVAELDKKGAIDQESKENYVQVVKTAINAKKAHRKEKSRTAIREALRNFYYNTILSYFSPEINVSRRRHL